MENFRELSNEEMQQIEGGDLLQALLTIGLIFFLWLESVLINPAPTPP